MEDPGGVELEVPVVAEAEVVEAEEAVVRRVRSASLQAQRDVR